MPRLSIVIPTRQRADTLVFAIETALAQTHTDFEIVVQNNGNDQATIEVVDSFNSPRIVLNGSPDILSMSANFEAALAASSGEFVAFIGDDDGMMPDACAICDAVMSHRPSLNALHWTPHYYDWPNSLRTGARNRLIVYLPGADAGRIRRSRDLLHGLYDGTLDWTTTPLIYNASFVRRSVIEKVRAHCGGQYFAGPIPDIHSGIANLWAMDEFLHIDRPLSICGASGHSNGNAHYVGSDGMPLQRRYQAENPILRQQMMEYFLDTANLDLGVASALIAAKEIFFKDDPDITVNMRAVLLRMGVNANRDPKLYDQTIAEMQFVARKYGVDTSDFKLPPKRQQMQDRSWQGPVVDAEGRTTMLAVNGAQAGISNILDAVRLTEALLARQTPAQLDDLLPRPAARPPVLGRTATGVMVETTMVPCRTIEVGVCRMPATPRGRAKALFFPDLLTDLPAATARAAPFLDRFDLAVCEWPGQGASGETVDASLPALAGEFAALVDHAMPDGRAMFAIGEGVGGLIALALARQRPKHIRNVILIDTPFLTRPALMANLAERWRAAGMPPYLRRLLREVMGFDPQDGREERQSRHFDLLADAPFNCAVIPGGTGMMQSLPSVLSDDDLAALRAVSPSLLITPRIAQAGHHVLREHAQEVLAELGKLLVRR